MLFAGAWLILRGRTGRAFRAVRDSETAAVSSGVSLARYKTLAFGISAAYAGVAGGLFAIASAFVNPDTFPVALSIFLLVGIVVGGLGGLSGLVFGAIFIAFLPLWAQGQDLGSLLPGPDHRGDAEAGRAGDRLRRRAHPPDVRAAERCRRAVPPHRAVDHESSLLSVEVIARRSVLVAVLGAALGVALPTAFAGSAADPGVSATTDRHRRNVAAHRPRRVVRLGRARREGVLSTS